MLLLVNDLTWVGAAGQIFADEVRAALGCGMQIMLMHELDPDMDGCIFGKMFEAGMTPFDLISKGVYSSIAAPFHPGGHRELSYALALKSMGAVEDKSKRAKRDKEKELWRQRQEASRRGSGS